MAKRTNSKSQDNGGGFFIALLFLALLQSVIFWWVTFLYHRDLMDRYFKNAGNGVRRINDFSAVTRPIFGIVLGPTLISLIYLGIVQMAFETKPDPVAIRISLLFSPLLLLWLWLGIVFYRWLAVAHFGVIVDPGKDRIVFQYDQESYDLVDYLKLRFIRALSPGFIHSMGLAGGQGVLISEVLNTGPAAQAGMAAGDILISVDGKNVGAENVKEVISGLPPGKVVRIEVLRNDTRRLLSVKVEPRP